MYQFISSLQESINDAGIMKAVFLGGIPGSGKTYISSAITDGVLQPRIVNFDKYYEFLTALGYPTDSRHIIDRSKIMSKTQLFHFVNGMLPLMIDTTSSVNSDRTLARIEMLKSIGYDIGCVWINTDLETALQRAMSRDRKVPESIIRAAKEREGASMGLLKAHSTFFTEIDNSGTKLDDAAIQSAYKAAKKFYLAPMQNPKGIQVAKYLSQHGQTELTPTIFSTEKLQSMIDRWYV